jgi:hypothetical protein
MNHHEMMTCLATELQMGFPAGEVDVDDEEASAHSDYTSVYTGEDFQLISYWREAGDEQSSSVHVRPLHVLGRYATADDSGMITLHLPCGTQFADGDTGLSDEFEDGLGNVCWHVPAGDEMGLVCLVRGLAAIAAEYYAPEALSARLVDSLQSAFPRASVEGDEVGMCIQFKGREGRTATVDVSLENVCNGGSGVIVVRATPFWLFDPYLEKNPQGSDEGDLTAAFANGSRFTNCAVDSEGPDGARGVCGFFQHTREQEESLFLGDMYQFVLCASKVAALVA